MYGTSDEIKRIVSEPIHWGSMHHSAGCISAQKRAEWDPIEIGIVGYMCSTTFQVAFYYRNTATKLSFTFIYVPAFETQGCEMLRVYLPN